MSRRRPSVRRLFAIVLVTTVAVSCNRERIPSELVEIAQPIDEQALARLRREAAAAKDDVQRCLAAVRDASTKLQSVALALLGAEMYLSALEQFEEALALTPTNGVVAYYAAVSAANHAKFEAEADRRRSYFDRAAYHYETAIRLNPRDEDALYGAAVLYAFEIDSPEAAADRAAALLEVNPSHVGGLFIAARVALQRGDRSLAIEYYRRIEEVADDPTDRATAIRNLEMVTGGGTE